MSTISLLPLPLMGFFDKNSIGKNNNDQNTILQKILYLYTTLFIISKFFILTIQVAIGHDNGLKKKKLKMLGRVVEHLAIQLNFLFFLI